MKLITYQLSQQRDLTTLVILILFIFILFLILMPKDFLTISNFQSMAFQLPELGFFALAMMVILLTGGINLSVITTANLSGVLTALLLTRVLSERSTSGEIALITGLSIGVCIGTSLLLGLLNGFLIAYIEVSPILATLGTMIFYDGIAIVITKGYVISNFPKAFVFIGNGVLGAIPFSIILFILFSLIVSLILNRTRFGFCLYMLGSNILATEYSGINIRSVLLKAYLLSGFLSGVASLIMISRFNSANAGYGSSYLLITVLLGVLGGVNPSGGFGKVSGLILALIILQLISSGLNLLGVSTLVALSLWGIILIMVIMVNNVFLPTLTKIKSFKKEGH